MCPVCTHACFLLQQSLEEKTAEQMARLARVESELQMERERVMTLTGQVQELEAGLHGNQSAAKAKQEQVDILQVGTIINYKCGSTFQKLLFFPSAC